LENKIGVRKQIVKKEKGMGIFALQPKPKKMIGPKQNLAKNAL
jgi:hypothetical protein